MNSEIFMNTLQEHIDIIFGEEEGPVVKDCMTMNENLDDENTSMDYPNYKGVMSNKKAYKYIKENVGQNVGLYNFLVGIFGIYGDLRMAGSRKYYATEILGYYIDNLYQFNLKISSMDVHKGDLITMLYISDYLSFKIIGSTGLPIIDIQNGLVVEEGDREFTIEESMLKDIEKIYAYVEEHLLKKKQKKIDPHKNDIQKKEEVEKVKILKKKALINNGIQTPDMIIKMKYFDMIYDELFSHIDTSGLSNKRSHRNDIKRKFMKEDPFDTETKKIDYTLHAFCVYFNHRVDTMLIS